MTLTCNVQNSVVTKFQFYRAGHLISGSGTSKTFTDNSVTFSDAGSYTCKAFIDTVESDASDAFNIKGWNLFFKWYFTTRHRKNNSQVMWYKYRLFLC